jgi:hypothetical protein
MWKELGWLLEGDPLLEDVRPLAMTERGVCTQCRERTFRGARMLYARHVAGEALIEHDKLCVGHNKQSGNLEAAQIALVPVIFMTGGKERHVEWGMRWGKEGREQCTAVRSCPCLSGEKSGCCLIRKWGRRRRNW